MFTGFDRYQTMRPIKINDVCKKPPTKLIRKKVVKKIFTTRYLSYELVVCQAKKKDTLWLNSLMKNVVDNRIEAFLVKYFV